MRPPLHIFDGFGIELEYMIVDTDTLQVRPITDEVLKAVAGEYVSDVESDDLCWSNELVLHVIELKTNGPASSIDSLDRSFHRDVMRINELLAPLGAMLLPGGAHPFMDPFSESKLWPHEYNEVYETYNAIFDCRGHGWSNLQSTHLNVPFANDIEFGKLHAAMRLVLPIIPALSASTPIIDSKLTGLLDTRLDFYRSNQKKIPSISGYVIPERVFSIGQYYHDILEAMYADIAPFDPKQMLRDDFLNSRGCIARFHRNTLEIKIIDIQECPRADMAILALLVVVLKAIVEETWIDFETQCTYHERDLAFILAETIHHGEQAVIRDQAYLRAFGYESSQCTAGELWQSMYTSLGKNLIPAHLDTALRIILEKGTLARRIINKLDNNPSRSAIIDAYREVASCLHNNRLFTT